MWITLSLPLLPGRLWTRVVAPETVLAIIQIELFDIYSYLELYIVQLDCRIHQLPQCRGIRSPSPPVSVLWPSYLGL